MTDSNDPLLMSRSIENPDPDLEDLLIERANGCLRCGENLSEVELKEGRKFCSYCVE
jgi:hypothetical protein